MKRAMKQLLDAFDAIAVEHDDVTDTDVRESVRDVIQRGFIRPKPRFTVPSAFGLSTPEANARVRKALVTFLEHRAVTLARKRLGTPRARLGAFQDSEVESGEGNAFDEYFGFAEEP